MSIAAAKRKEKEKKETEKIFDFCARPIQYVTKRDTSGKKGRLSCCNCIFDQIKANLAKIQPQNHQNVQKRIFGKKLRGLMGYWNEYLSSL